jgi:divalent metal cation (Fe/Co/Zn/Cd) transporter
MGSCGARWQGVRAARGVMSAGHTRAGLVRFAQGGMLLNALLAVVKGLAGVLGNSYALVADAVESASDVAA